MSHIKVYLCNLSPKFSIRLYYRSMYLRRERILFYLLFSRYYVKECAINFKCCIIKDGGKLPLEGIGNINEKETAIHISMQSIHTRKASFALMS